MSYLARLVGRGVGAPGGTASARLGPVFPLGRAPFGVDETEVGPELLPSSLPESPPPRAPVPLPSDAAAAAIPVPTPVGAAPALPPRQAEAREESPAVRGRQSGAGPGRTTARAATPPTVTTADLTIRPAVPGTRPRTDPDEPLAPIPPGIEIPAGPPTVTAVPRADTTREPLPVRGDRESRAAPEPAPQIEVRIGRVEVRRPPEPEPVQWPADVSQPSAAAAGFDRLAAARRYVDRRWS